MSSKFFARVHAGSAGQPAQPARRSLRGIARAKLRASKAASAAHLAAGAPLQYAGHAAHADYLEDAQPSRRVAGIPPGQAGAISRAVTDGACGCVTDAAAAAPAARIRVWDLPTRLFHWSLVLAVTVAVATGLLGGDWMPLHGYAGIAITGLVAFRLAWGMTGPVHARFAHFAPTPGRLRSYLAGRWQGHGHNPLGALSVFALLALLGVQAGTGLAGNDEIAFQGPLAPLVDESTSLRLTGLHQQLAYVLLGLIVLHILAIGAYLTLRKANLVKPMITGWKEVAAEDPGSASPVRVAGRGSEFGDGGAVWRWSALVSAAGVAVLAMALASGAGLAGSAVTGDGTAAGGVDRHASNAAAGSGGVATNNAAAAARPHDAAPVPAAAPAW